MHNKLRNENESENEKKNELVKYNLRSQLQQQLPTVTFKKKKEQLDNLQNAANFYSAASKIKLQSRFGGQFQLQDADSAWRGQLIRPLPTASTADCQEYPFRQLQKQNRPPTFQRGASKKRPSERQLRPEQLGRRDP